MGDLRRRPHECWKEKTFPRDVYGLFDRHNVANLVSSMHLGPLFYPMILDDNCRRDGEKLVTCTANGTCRKSSLFTGDKDFTMAGGIS